MLIISSILVLSALSAANALASSASILLWRVLSAASRVAIAVCRSSPTCPSKDSILKSRSCSELLALTISTSNLDCKSASPAILAVASASIFSCKPASASSLAVASASISSCNPWTAAALKVACSVIAASLAACSVSILPWRVLSAAANWLLMVALSEEAADKPLVNAIPWASISLWSFTITSSSDPSSNNRLSPSFCSNKIFDPSIASSAINFFLICLAM